MESGMQYYAFISYKREEEKWAKWLQHKLEHYRFPTSLNGHGELPKYIRPTFRDVTDLEPGLLAEKIDKALRTSQWLIVVCSPRSAQSPWVCKEAQTFIDLGRADHIIPFVIEGTPFSQNESEECYPEALRSLTGKDELLAANINEMGRDAAVIKVIAQMFGLRFDSLWQRYEREKNRRRNWMMSAVAAFVMAVISVAGLFAKKNVELRQSQDQIQLALKRLKSANEKTEKEKNRAQQAERFLANANDSISNQNQLIRLQSASLIQANLNLEEEKKRLEQANNELLIRESKILSREAESVMDRDSYLARKMAVAALPKDLQNPDRPYVAAAERALRNANNRSIGVFGPDTIVKGRLSVEVLGNEIFMIINNVVYEIDTSDGNRTPLFEFDDPGCNIGTAMARDQAGNPLFGFSYDSGYIKLWRLYKRKYEKYDSVYFGKSYHPEILGISRGGKTVFSKKSWMTYSDTVIDVFNRMNNGVWTNTQSIRGNLFCAQKLANINNIYYKTSIITYSREDEKIYVWKIGKDEKYYCTDTLETAGEIKWMEWKDYMICANGYKGLHIYYYEGGCWQWRELIKELGTTYSTSISIVNNDKFYTTKDEYVLCCSRENNHWEWDKLKTVRKFYIEGSGHLNLINSLNNLLVSENSVDRLQIVSNSPQKRYRDYYIRDAYYYQDNGVLLSANPQMKDAVPFILVEEARTKKIIDTLYGHTDTIFECRYSNGYLLSVSKDCSLRIWKRNNGKYQCIDIVEDTCFKEPDISFSINKSGTIVQYQYFNYNNKRNIWIKNFNQWQKLLQYQDDGIMGFYGFPNLVISNDNYTPLVEYDSLANKLMLKLFNPILGTVKILCSLGNAFNIIANDLVGNAIATSKIFDDRNIYLYLIKNKVLTKTMRLEGHEGPVTYLDFSPDGKYLLSTAKDGTIRVWEVASGECVEVLKADGDIFEKAYFTEDGETILSVSNYGVTYRWNFFSLQKLIDRTRERFGNSLLEQDEVKSYYSE